MSFDHGTHILQQFQRLEPDENVGVIGAREVQWCATTP